MVASPNEVRSFLRHLDEPNRLRGNPLAEGLCGSSLRLVAEETISRLPWRSRTILMRCDLGGELNRIVACDLGICLRQFYRERSRALCLLAELFSKNDVHMFAPTVVVEPDIVRTFLGYANALENAGRFEEAISHLERLSSDGIQREARARVECRIVSLCCDYGDSNRARRHLDIAKAITDTLPVGDLDRAMLIIETEAARAKLCFVTGTHAKSKAIAEATLGKLRTLDRSAFRERHSETSANLLLLLARLCSDAAEFGEGLSAALEARAILERGNMSHTRLLVESLAMSAGIRLLTPRGLTAAIVESTQAYEVAQRLGLVRQCANIANSFAGIHFFKRDLDRAAAFAREAMDVGRLACSQEEFLEFSANLATIHLSRGDVVSARQALSDTRTPVAATSVPLANVLQLPAAEAFLMETDFLRALATAQMVGRGMRAIGNARFLGAALRIEAEAHSGLGNSRLAAHAIYESVELLVDHPQPFSLSRTYASAARLTGKAVYARAARELTQALRLS